MQNLLDGCDKKVFWLAKDYYQDYNPNIFCYFSQWRCSPLTDFLNVLLLNQSNKAIDSRQGNRPRSPTEARKKLFSF
jgi:hypothetical protein